MYLEDSLVCAFPEIGALFTVLAKGDDTGARTTEGFECGGGDDVVVLEGVGKLLDSDNG